MSKRSETIFCYIKSKLKKKRKLCPPEPKHLEEVVLYEAQISKIFEKISKPTSLAIREFLDKKLYYIFKKQLKKTIKQIIKNKLRNQLKNQSQDPFGPFGNQLEKEKEEEEEEKKLVKNLNFKKKFKIKLEKKLKKKLEKKFQIKLEKNFQIKFENPFKMNFNLENNFKTQFEKYFKIQLEKIPLVPLGKNFQTKFEEFRNKYKIILENKLKKKFINFF
ncbi:hypothetical protein CE122_000235 [Candidatus Sulcia muelleri]|uniref:hypothetical protein n=1 Tax=Candidatus Karelsulcia muelleri TaxID=336810 RepID=UPI001FA0FD16|nr:hypothetical protein [Candidatus Karelsulcia muelleri]NHU72410.1 hypothetical protein [Candidatus Karelsulcia muelleri]